MIKGEGRREVGGYSRGDNNNRGTSMEIPGLLLRVSGVYRGRVRVCTCQ